MVQMKQNATYPPATTYNKLAWRLLRALKIKADSRQAQLCYDQIQLKVYCYDFEICFCLIKTKKTSHLLKSCDKTGISNVINNGISCWPECRLLLWWRGWNGGLTSWLPLSVCWLYPTFLPVDTGILNFFMLPFRKWEDEIIALLRDTFHLF